MYPVISHLVTLQLESIPASEQDIAWKRKRCCECQSCVTCSVFTNVIAPQ